MKTAIVGNLVKFTFDENVPSLTTDLTKWGGANQQNAKMYGAQVRLTRMAALARSGKDGAVITITERMRHDEIAAGIAHYESATDHWELRQARAPVQNPVWVAMAVKRSVEYDVIAAEHAQADLDALAAL